LSLGNPSEETEVLPTIDAQADTPTKLDNRSKRAPTNPTGGSGRFISGTVLAGRYRIAGLIGKGGMGEVYKAHDLELDQTVALKFLPEELSDNDDFLRRFRAEVRTARQVSHRNVCRVFDLGESGGLYYITMEYIDGDDLSMLLKRIGRLPSDKAVEISREICMGLGAIHKAGILHRDLKPANIIIDSKGEARITDFGIAAIETELQGAEARVGTPAYMSPEQIDGKEVTPRSDIYSLGLLLYEIFTGKPAFEGESVQELRIKHATTNPTNPSEIVTGIDPLVENVIKRCLQKDPQQRPETAIKVAMSLPGGDPLQIALDAGQTPSPEMVAASPKTGTLRPVIAFLLLASVFLGFGFTALTSKYLDLSRHVPLDKPPEFLHERSRELVEEFGYRQIDSYSAFTYESGYIDYLRKNDQSPERWQHLASGQPSVIQFWYRTSPNPLAPFNGVRVREDDPPNTVSGMARLRLDTKGRLIFFEGVPPRVDEPEPATDGFDWTSVIKEAGFDIANFQSVQPQWIPSHPFDEQRAYSGKYPDQPDISILVQAAAYRGKLVSFEIVEPWTPPPGQTDTRYEGASFTLQTIILFSLYFGVLFVSGWLAVKNIRGGRSDVRGAIRIMLFLFAARFIIWASTTHHIGGEDEIRLLITGLQSALYWSASAGLMYLAFEPYMRKSAPERVISWNRLLAGDWRDPLVGRDALIGSAVASIVGIGVLSLNLAPSWMGQPPRAPGVNPETLTGISGFPRQLLEASSDALFLAFILSFLILFTGLLLRRKSRGVVAVLLVVVILGILDGIGNENRPLEVAGNTLAAVALVLVPARFGVLAMIFFWLFMRLMDNGIPFGTWYTGGYAAYAAVLLALAIFGFYTSPAGQKLWQGNLLADGD
jgi:serine/threonine-protein kinase